MFRNIRKEGIWYLPFIILFFMDMLLFPEDSLFKEPRIAAPLFVLSILFALFGKECLRKFRLWMFGSISIQHHPSAVECGGQLFVTLQLIPRKDVRCLSLNVGIICHERTFELRKYYRNGGFLYKSGEADHWKEEVDYIGNQTFFEGKKILGKKQTEIEVCFLIPVESLSSQNREHYETAWKIVAEMELEGGGSWYKEAPFEVF